ncbi:hypothetical protein BKI52_15335 [marine bacterium AO1-C]|nr:hypothetical protein BKI52_15335 [marine bacterium AO1-C]
MNASIGNQENSQSQFVPFAQSPLWQLQRAYFERTNVKAWSTGEVPHYVTSNPYTAKAYAQLILGFLRDNYTPQQPNAPIYIVELGTGSGRFSYRLLLALAQLAETVADHIPKFVYVMTDFVQDTLDFWETHPRLKSFFESGLLDYALFDAEKDTSLYLQKRQQTIAPGDLSQPIITIANYFFDAIPQQLFYIDEGQAYQGWTKLGGYNPETPPTSNEALASLSIQFEYHGLDEIPFEQPSLQQLFRQYKSQMENSYLLFPHIGLNCLLNLKALSLKGLFLITADKAVHALEKWQNRPEPQFAKHSGCFSLTVNYHALKAHCGILGGQALLPKQSSLGITVGAFLYVKNPERYRETLLSYQRHVNEFGVDDFFSIKKHIEQDIESLSLRSLFAYLRLAHYDPRLFRQFLPQFRALASQADVATQQEVVRTIQRVWRNYYPIGEDEDLAAEIGILLHEIDLHDEALTFFKWSEKIFGPKEITQVYQALCHWALDKPDVCQSILEQVLVHNPTQRIALHFLKKLKHQASLASNQVPE